MNTDQSSLNGLGDLIVIVASDGSIEQLTTLVGTFSADIPAPVLIAISTDLARLTQLGAILQRRTPLAVEIVTAQNTLLPGQFYLLSTLYPTSIDAGVIKIEPVTNLQTALSSDQLLSQLSQLYGDRLTAIRLAGIGNDGVSGIVEVKNNGGTVIVQGLDGTYPVYHNPAIPPSIVDFELEIDRIADVAQSILTDVVLQPPTDQIDDLLSLILEQVNQQANIDFRLYKTTTILRRIARRMVVTHNQSMVDYLGHLQQYPAEVGELVQALLINVTQFFRDPDAFEYLKTEVLPVLIEQGREKGRVLRFWSAGCATGEEPYSLAMLLALLLGSELPEWSIKIFATDLDEAAISFARLGVYPENLLRTTPLELRQRFFDQLDHSFRISKLLRQMVIFGQQDLSRSAPFPRMDLVMCRNVLIYFTPELQDYVLNQFAFSLRPNKGYLFLGKAEIIRSNHSYYELINKQWKIYRCTNDVIPVPRRQPLSELQITGPDRRTASRSALDAERTITNQRALSESNDLGQLRRFNEHLLRFLPVGVVVIDRSYRLISANAAARRLLSLREIATDQDFLHAVRGIPYTTVRNAIDTVFRERNNITLPEVVLDSNSGGNGRFVLITIVPMQLDASTADLAALSINDVTEQIQIRQRLETVQTEQHDLLDELGSANKRLNDLNKELMDANEELQVSNEEMMLTYEELQSTNEEFEATNEELQATNEELETNNEELQSTNEELQTTNDELRARTSELQELASMLETERVRLAEMVELAPFYIMVLHGTKLLIEAFNPRYARLLDGRKIQGRPLGEVTEVFWASDEPLNLAHEVYQSDTIRTSPRILSLIPNEHGELLRRYFVYTIVPTHDVQGHVDGIVIYAVDETTQLMQTQQANLAPD
jgi:two-component system CheB/CheR fusion protein